MLDKYYLNKGKREGKRETERKRKEMKGGREKEGKKKKVFFSDTIKMGKNTGHVSIVVGSNLSSAFY